MSSSPEIPKMLTMKWLGTKSGNQRQAEENKKKIKEKKKTVEKPEKT